VTSHQRQQAIDNVEERIATLLRLFEDSSNSIAHRYRANLAENIVDGVIALTRDQTPEELAHLAHSMHHARERWSRLRKAETHS
jgi:t-SNARE complex subunit (syntaxin)